jgi:hypothetical protein
MLQQAMAYSWHDGVSRKVWVVITSEIIREFMPGVLYIGYTDTTLQEG